MSYSYQLLTPTEVPLLKSLLKMFAEAFEDPLAYQGAVPSDAYLEKFLEKDHAIVLVALGDDGTVVGGLVAYELEKFEQDRREIYIYDLAVLEAHRRKSIATTLIKELQKIAKERKAYVIFVQADPPDTPAVRLYQKLGTREDVYHFDISV